MIDRVSENEKYKSKIQLMVGDKLFMLAPVFLILLWLNIPVQLLMDNIYSDVIKIATISIKGIYSSIVIVKIFLYYYKNKRNIETGQ